MRETWHDTGGDWITHRCDDDRNRPSPFLCGDGGRRARRQDDVSLEPDCFRHQPGEPIVPAFGPAVLDVDVLAFDVVEIAQPLAKGVDELGLKRG